MFKFYVSLIMKRKTYLSVKFSFLLFILLSGLQSVSAQVSDTLAPVADAYTRNGSYASTNYGSDTSLIIKTSPSSGFSRNAYLKFSLNSLTTISSAKIRIYGRNTENTSSINLSVFSIDDDSWG